MDTVDLFDPLSPEDKRLAYQHAVMMLRESDAERERIAAELETLRAELKDEGETATANYDAIAAACGCPQWDYPGQVVRDVQTLAAELAAIKADVGPLLGRLANYIGRWPATLLSERYDGDADAEVARSWAARLGKEE